jgi:hypothetical protein
MYIYTQTRTTRDPPPPGAQLFTSVSVCTVTQVARQVTQDKLTCCAFFWKGEMYSNDVF